MIKHTNQLVAMRTHTRTCAATHMGNPTLHAQHALSCTHKMHTHAFACTNTRSIEKRMSHKQAKHNAHLKPMLSWMLNHEPDLGADAAVRLPHDQMSTLVPTSADRLAMASLRQRLIINVAHGHRDGARGGFKSICLRHCLISSSLDPGGGRHVLC